VSALQHRFEALWQSATPVERQALHEHVRQPLPPYLGGLLASHGIPPSYGQPAGGPPAPVMPQGLAAWIREHAAS
jgi:hypothetical protein